MLSNILNIYCKNIFNNFLIAESCRTRTRTRVPKRTCASLFLAQELPAIRKKNRWHIRAFESARANFPVYFNIFTFQNISHQIIYFILHLIKILIFLNFTILINSTTFCLKPPGIFHSNQFTTIRNPLKEDIIKDKQ